MNEQLAAAWAQHRTALMVAGAAGVAGLAYLKRKKGTAGGTTITPGGTVLGAVSPQTVPASGGAYDSSAADVYNSLQSELEQLRAPAQGAPLTTPAPVASSIFAPSGSGSFVQYGDGSIWEAESDGSLFGVTGQQWNQQKAGGATLTRLRAQRPTGPWWTTQGNLAAKAQGLDMSKGTGMTGAWTPDQ